MTSAVEGMGGLGLMGSIAAFVSMLCALCALSVTAFIAYRIRDDIKGLEDIKSKLTAHEKLISEEIYVSDEIANVLYDHYGLISALYAYHEISRLGAKPSDKLDEHIKQRFSVTEKHFAELGLFSRDEVRRKSVQQSLASMYGDLRTLDIMRRIKDGHFGVSDRGIARAHDMLRQRLMRNGGISVDSYAWTGRPSGGAF